MTELQQPPEVDLAGMRRYRLDRVRQELAARDYAGIVLFDPCNIRYASDARNMQVWTLHNPARYLFVAAAGPVVLFDFHNCEFIAADIATIDEIRPARSWYYFAAGPRVEEMAALWATEMPTWWLRMAVVTNGWRWIMSIPPAPAVWKTLDSPCTTARK